MNCGSGAFQGSWSWLSSLPNFLGFSPSSRAICTCACERWWRLRASTQSWRFCESFLLPMASSFVDKPPVRLAPLRANRRRPGQRKLEDRQRLPTAAARADGDDLFAPVQVDALDGDLDSKD